MIEKNFPFEHEGETLWYSRSCAVVGVIINDLKGDISVLVNKRGEGAPNFKGEWNLPCGFIDFNESGEEAVQRETLEETGFKTILSSWRAFSVETTPKAFAQNITIRYVYICSGGEKINQKLSVKSLKGGETNEVADIKWVNIKDLKKYKWAFDHDKLIEMAVKVYQNKLK